jgi:hypothetical protein
MSALSQSILLFILNWLDAQLTIMWVRANVATEGNSLMARLLDLGDAPFLSVKLAVGAFAAYVLYRFSHVRLARRGLKLALTLYVGIMFAHAATGMSVLGWQGPAAAVAYVGHLPNAVLAFFS